MVKSYEGDEPCMSIYEKPKNKNFPQTVAEKANLRQFLKSLVDPGNAGKATLQTGRWPHHGLCPVAVSLTQWGKHDHVLHRNRKLTENSDQLVGIQISKNGT